MEQYINKNRVEKILRNLWKKDDGHNAEHRICYNKALQEVQCELDTLEVKESDETAEAFARIIRANLTGIDKDVQYKFEQLYKEITGEKMYQGYND